MLLSSRKRRSEKPEQFIISDDKIFSEFNKIILNIKSSMEDTTPRTFGNQLSVILNNIEGRITNEQFNIATQIALHLQKEQLSMYNLNIERKHEILKLSALSKIADKEATKELASEGIMIQKTKQQMIDKIVIFLPSFILALGSGYATDTFKNDMMSALSVYKSYFTDGCTLKTSYILFSKEEKVNSIYCKYVGPALQYGIGGIAENSSLIIDKTGAYATYIVMIIVFFISLLIFKFINIRKINLTGAEFDGKRKSKKSKRKSKKSKRKSKKSKRKSKKKN
jgi:hypothetical protein